MNRLHDGIVSADFTLANGATAISLFPGSHRDAGASNDIWLASGIVEEVHLELNPTAILMGITVHDYSDANGAIIKGGTPSAAGRLTISNTAALRASPLVAGGNVFECYNNASTALVAAFGAFNRRAIEQFTCSTAGGWMRLKLGILCPHGMCVSYAGAALTAARACTVLYRPQMLGAQRKRLYDQYRTAPNARGLAFT